MKFLSARSFDRRLNERENSKHYIRAANVVERDSQKTIILGTRKVGDKKIGT
jgi:GTPase Era involved in 16S rRNA processing